jgi:hypothetical protein
MLNLKDLEMKLGEYNFKTHNLSSQNVVTEQTRFAPSSKQTRKAKMAC